MEIDKKTQKRLDCIAKLLGIPSDQVGSLTELAVKIADSQPDLNLPFVPDFDEVGYDDEN